MALMQILTSHYTRKHSNARKYENIWEILVADELQKHTTVTQLF